MPFEITNSLRSTSIIRIQGTGDTTVSLANLAYDANETVTDAKIKRIYWSTNGNVQVVRNSVPLLSLHNTGEMRLDDFGHTIANNSTQSIVVTINTGGCVIMEVSKTATYANVLTGM